MNRKLLALAVGTALSLPVVGMAAPTVYGQLNVSLDNARTSVGNTILIPVAPPAVAPEESWQVNSNASRLGVTGEEALGEGLTAIYKIEYGVTGDVAGAAGTDLVGRDRFVGLKGNFGTVRLGGFNSPLKSMQGMVDQFLDMRYADMSLGLAGVKGYHRMNNAIGYTSPKLAEAVTVNVLLQPGETKANNGLAEAFSTSVDYNANGTYVGLGYDSETSNGDYATATGWDIVRLAFAQTMGKVQVGALLQTAKLANVAPDKKQDTMLVSGAYTMDKNVLKAQLALVRNDLVLKERREVLNLGFDHNCTKMTKLYAQTGFGRVSNVTGVAGNAKNYIFTVGMQTKF